MSSTGWIFVGLLILSPFCEAADIKENPVQNQSRQRRSILNLNSMVKTVTGREGSDFIGYGNWCGLGGSGRPIDPIDECCQIHDLCYNLATSGVCQEHGEKGVYKVNYKWKTTNDGMATCEDNEDECKNSICMCDAMLSNCLKNNIDSYDDGNLHTVNLFEILKEADWLSSA